MARSICAKVGTYFLTYSTFNLKCKCLINVPASGELIFAHRRMSLPWMVVMVDFYEKEEKILHTYRYIYEREDQRYIVNLSGFHQDSYYRSNVRD